MKTLYAAAKAIINSYKETGFNPEQSTDDAVMLAVHFLEWQDKMERSLPREDAAPPLSWTELEAKCLASGGLGDSFRDEILRDGVRVAFAFLARHLPPASVCMAAGEMKTALEDVVRRWGSDWTAQAKAALKAAEGGER